MRPEHTPPIRLSRLAEICAARQAPADRVGEDRLVSGISLSSQRIRPGDLYAALPGTRTHGARFLAEARAAGAVAVLTDPEGATFVSDEFPRLVVPDPRAVLGELSAEIYDRPTTKLRLLGITGTQGKTTTSRLIVGALEELGVRCGVVGTLGTRIAGEDVATALTTPEATDLQALLAVMVERGVSDAALEVSSHAVVLGRVDAARCAVAGFTNLGRDHLDFHPTMADYFAAKAELFTPGRAEQAVVCIDDAYGRRLAERAEIPITTVGLAAGSAQGAAGHPHWQAHEVVTTADRTRARVVGPGAPAEGISLEIALPGAFNLANGLVALAMLAAVGHDPVAVAAALARCVGVPGRLEPIRCGQQFSVLVDYAHKPDALEATLATLRPLTDGKILLVIGAGGDRDAGKRPMFGAIGSRAAEVTVVTDDNPRSEDAAAIRAAILAGVDGPGVVVELGDRRTAIRAALRRAEPGDIVLIAGKGHETGQEVDGVVTPFDDRVVAAEELRALLAERSGASA